uniref:WAT1-related protein n=1 Tax=Oryza meridionalis TaxID=40149 RepID=A0A0E0DF05_9ORYZ
MGSSNSWKPTLTMVGVVVVFAVMNTLTKMAFNEGMRSTVLITLRQLIATLFLAPIAYFRERASLTQWLFFLGLQYTTATFACAFINMTPIFTFIVALPYGLEKVDLKTGAGIAKVGGTVLGFSGAMILALYQGPSLTKLEPAAARSSSSSSSSSSSATAAVVGHGGGGGAHRWAIGSVALLGGSACWSLWFILQSRIAKKYPALYSGTALMFLLSFLQMAAVALAVDRISLSPWILTTKLQIITVLFVGIVGSGIAFLAMSWCVEQRGPVFTTAFTPLIQIIAAAINVIVLHEQLHLGIVIGSALVIMGLYFVLWGKSKEASSSSSSAAKEDVPPLRQQYGGHDQERTTNDVQMQTV